MSPRGGDHSDGKMAQAWRVMMGEDSRSVKNQVALQGAVFRTKLAA